MEDSYAEGGYKSMAAEKEQPEQGKVEITLCLYSDGSMKIRVDDSEEIAVESLDQALAGIKAFAAEEGKAIGDKDVAHSLESGDMQAKLDAPEEEPEEDEAMASGFRGVRGGGYA